MATASTTSSPDASSRGSLVGVDEVTNVGTPALEASPHLAETIRDVLGARVAQGTADGGAEPRVDAALSVMSVLLELGWSPPETVLDELAAELVDHDAPGPRPQRPVRSLAEDLAVVRARARTSRERSAEVRRRARRVLDRAAVVHARAVAQARPVREVDPAPGAAEAKVAQLEHALATRPGIEHAVGMVMLVRGCDRDEAWDVLSRLSMAANRKVLDIADAMVAQARGGGLSPQLTATLRNV